MTKKLLILTKKSSILFSLYAFILDIVSLQVSTIFQVFEHYRQQTFVPLLGALWDYRGPGQAYTIYGRNPSLVRLQFNVECNRPPKI